MKFTGVALLLILAAALAGLAVAGEEKGAALMVLNGGKSGNVPFPHALHQATLSDCQQCHDLFPQQAGSIDGLKSDGTLKSKQVMNQKCTKCHRKLKKAGQKTGPVSCKKCHSIKS